MKLSHLPLLLFLLICTSAHAQVSDSLWCDHLAEIIKCVSTHTFTDRISKDLSDSTAIPAFIPELRLSKSKYELIKKEYNKVSYECYFYTQEMNDQRLQKQFVDWYKKIKSCLPQWEEARLPNANNVFFTFDDYFFTNSEDETAVRLDIIKDNGFQVRIRIF